MESKSIINMSLIGSATTNCSTYDALAESAAKVAIFNFRWQYVTLILFNSTFPCGVNTFIKSYGKSYLIGQSTFLPWFVENTRQFALFLRDLKELEELLLWLKTQGFNNTGKHLIICNTLSEDACDLNQAAAMFWKYRMANALLIKYDATQKPAGYSFFLDPSSCIVRAPMILKQWFPCTQENDIKSCGKMFPLKLENLNLCPLSVSTIEQKPYMILKDGLPRGADGDLLRIIMKSLNASLVTVNPRLGKGWGKLEENGTWSGSLADVYYGWANMSMTSASITLHRFRYFQMSKDYNTVTIVWVTHPSVLEPSLFKLLKPFTTKAKIFICIGLILFILLALFLKTKYWRVIRRMFKLQDVPDGFIFYSWAVCVGMPVTKLPKRWILLYFIFLGILFCYIIRTLYQVYLMNSLQSTDRLDSIFSIEDAIKDGYSFGGGLALKDYFIDNPVIYNNYKNIESNQINSTLVEISEGKTFVIAVNLEATKVFIRESNRKLHILPKIILSSPTVIFFKKYSTLTHAVDHILTNLIECGLVDKLYKENTFVPPDGDKDAPKPITMRDYSGCFMVLGVGWIFSIITFIIEKYIHRRRMKINQIATTSI